ncbi:hypothetical protein LINPERHAP2_LOCUS23761 [Linum perenne]
MSLHLFSRSASEGLLSQATLCCLLLLHLDNIWYWINNACDWELSKPQVKCFMWIHSPPFLLNWRDLVFCTCPLFCCLLHLCHCSC